MNNPRKSTGRPWSALLALAVLSCGSPPPADLVVFGRIWTGVADSPWAQALAVNGGRLTMVGDSSAVASMVGADTRILSAPGMVVPGFMDGHAHFISGGFQLASVNLRDAATPEEFVRRIGTYASTLEPGEWITGGDWDHERWGGELPRRDWIDSVTPVNPVFITRSDGHMSLANSVALELAGVDRSTADIPGGVIVRYPNSSRPTGLVKDEAQGPVIAAIPDATVSQQDSALARALQHAAMLGVTTIAEVNGNWANRAAYLRARDAGRLTARVRLYAPLSRWREVADTIAAVGQGDEWIRLQGLKGFVDGSLGSTTAAFDEPYSDDPATSGIFVTDEAELRESIGAADSAGLQLAIHAIGDRANRLLLNIYDSVAQAHGPRDRRFRIEHAQHLDPVDLDRFAPLGVIPSMQPYHAADDGRWAEKRIGPERIKTTYAFRSLLDAQARLAFGSDWTVAPLDPLLGIHAAVTRETIDGANPDGWVPEQRIDVVESLRAYTAANAYGFFDEQQLGTLAPGFLADFVVLDRDLTAVPASELDQASVLATVVGGRLVYRDPTLELTP